MRNSVPLTNRFSRKSKRRSGNLKNLLTRLEFNVERRISLYRDLRNSLESGKTPYSTLEAMLVLSQPRRSLKWLVSVLKPVCAQMRKGKSFAASLAQWVPADEVALIAIGEETESLVSSLDELCTMMEHKRKVRQTITGLVSNLVSKSVVVTALFFFNAIYVLGQGRTMVQEGGMEKTVIAGKVISVTDFMTGSGAWLIVLFVAAVISISLSLSRWRPTPLRSWLDANAPVYSLYARTQTAYFMLACGAMMRAGRPFNTVLVDLKAMSTPWQRTYLLRILTRLTHGKSEVEAMRIQMIPWNVQDRLAMYADQSITDVMRRCAINGMEELQTTLKKYGAVIDMCFMLASGAVVVVTMASMMDISYAIKSESTY
jgi:type II secretory pathway component PulF